MRTLAEIKAYCIEYYTLNNTTTGLTLYQDERRLLYRDLNLSTIRDCVTQLVYGKIDRCVVCSNKILVGPPAENVGTNYCYRHKYQCIVCGLRNKTSPKFCTSQHAYLFTGDVFYDEYTKTWTTVTSGGETVVQNITVNINPYQINTPYTKNTLVKYTHTTGLVNSITVNYILSAREDITNTEFDIFDWRVVGQKVWIFDRASLESESYEIFPGDLISVAGEKLRIPNSHNGIILSNDLLAEGENPNHRNLGSGVSSIQLADGQNIIYVNYPVYFDEYSYGIVDNHLINGGRGNSILFDNIPDDFELYIKVTVDGDPNKRISYPELPSSFYTRFYFTSNHWSILETSDFTVVNSGYKYVQEPMTFTADDDFYYYKFWKTSLLPKVRFTKYAKNTIPNGL